MTYEEFHAYLASVSWRGSRLGLSRITELLRRMGDPQKSLRCIHVAGTNGKGSTCAMLSHILCAAGYKVGLHTSPYVNEFAERFQINNTPIGDAALLCAMETVKAHAEQMADRPTEFELLCAVSLLWFARENCDYVVIEVGMGGRLDATNVIDTPLLAVITAMGFDHTASLGNTMREIATEKAGIIKPGGTVVIYGENAEAETVFAEVCAARGAVLYKTDFSLYDSEKYTLGLQGAYQRKNAALVLQCVAILRDKGISIPEEAVVRGLAQTRWPARFETLHANPTVILDGGHNPHGVQAALASLLAGYPNRKYHFVIGLMADKDIDGMLAPLAPHAVAMYAIATDYPRALCAATLADRMRRYCENVLCAESVEAGVRLAMDAAGKDGVVCVIGSLYMAGEVRRLFGK
ncbi:MAG: bifunctional folylpolyglutamate synthase/dihydrofolate synthase [Clostridiales bacterium]|nr:bifunctional folylpolyglutamate synthase/dihydrofolate synthase [Clostridiales bacterium]